MKNKLTVKTLTLSLIARSMLAGCASKDDFAAVKEEPSKEIITVLNVEPISKDYIDYRVNKINSKYYEQNFVQKKLAGQEEEMGIYSVNKSKNLNHKIEKVKNDEFDSVVNNKNSNTKPLPNLETTRNNVEHKNHSKIANSSLIKDTVKKSEPSKNNVSSKTTEKVNQKMLIQSSVEEKVIDNNSNNGVVSSSLNNSGNSIAKSSVDTNNSKLYSNTSSKSNNLSEKEKEKYDVLKKVFVKEYPFMIEINGDSDFINDLKTGQEYIVTISDSNVNLYEKSSNNLFKEIQMFSKKVYNYMSTNKTENNYMRAVDIKEIEKLVNITFKYENGALTFYNDKFKKVLALDEELEINNNGSNIKFKIDNSLIDFNSTENKLKQMIKR